MREKADTDLGWFKVSDDLAQALARAQLTANEYAICWWVLCRTYAVRQRAPEGHFVARKFTPYSARRIAADIGRDHRGITRSLYDLLGQDRQVLRIGDRQEIGFNTRIGTWAKGLIRGDEDGWEAGTLVPTRGRLSPGGAGTPVPTKGDARPRKRGRLSPPPRTRARGEREGENRYPLPPEGGGEASFEESFQPVWNAYPEAKRGIYARALRVWRRMNPSLELTADILAGIKAHAASQEWAMDGGRWIPGMAKWLREERWTLKVTPAASAPAGPRCGVCGVRPAAKDAKVCSDCSWCVPCDDAGRKPERRPQEIAIKNGRGICRDCFASGGKR